MSLWRHRGAVCLLDGLTPSGSAHHPGRAAAPGRLLCSSHPALSLGGFSPSPLMPPGRIQWDFKGVCNVEMPVQPGRVCRWAQTLPLHVTNVNLLAGTGTRAIHHCMAVWVALPFERPLHLFPQWGSRWPPFPASRRQMGGRAVPTTSSFGLGSLRQPQEQRWCLGRWDGCQCCKEVLCVLLVMEDRALTQASTVTSRHSEAINSACSLRWC